MKNKLLSFSLLSICIITTFSSCHKKQEMEMRDLSYANRFYLNQADTALGALAVNINMEMPDKYADNEVLTNIQKQIIAKVFGEQYNSVPVDSVIPKYVDKLHKNYLRDYDEAFQASVKKAGGPSMSNEISIDGVSLYLDEKILSYSYESYAYLGGAHGNSNRMLYNYDLSNAHTIKEQDLFIADYKVLLTQLIKDQILEQSAELGSVADLNDLNFWEDEIKPNDNFYISDEGLVYIFNPYEIAPYSMGQTEVMLPYDKLRPLLKKGNILEYLYNTTAQK